MTQLTYQEEMVWARLEGTMSEIVSVNQSLASRAAVVLRGSSLAAVAASLVLVVPEPPAAVAVILSAIALLALFSLYLAGQVWQPADSVLLGTDTDRMYEEYINKESDEAFGQGLIDMEDVIEKEVDRNSEIAGKISLMIIAFQIQLALFVVAIWVQMFCG